MGVFEEIANSLVSFDNSSEGDYYKDGFRMCGKCHTPKQAEVDVLGKLEKVSVMCKCMKAEQERQWQAEKQEKVKKYIGHLQKMGITDEEYLKWTLESDDKRNLKISNAVSRYISKWDEMLKSNTGILFFGPVGTGKTFYAACIANKLIEKGVPVIMTNIVMLINQIQDADTLARISNTPLLILDDIGTERTTSYGFEKTQEIIDTRYRSGKPLIVTTNLSPEELKNPEDMRYKRVYDRILENCYPILVDGESRRVEKSKEKRKEIKNILGV